MKKEQCDKLASHIYSGVIVVAKLRSGYAIPGKDDRRRKRCTCRRVSIEHGEVLVASQVDGLARTSADCKRRGGRNQLGAAQVHSIEIRAVLHAAFEAESRELRLDLSRRQLVAAGPGAGSKLGKAEELGVRIIDAAQFALLLKEGPAALD